MPYLWENYSTQNYYSLAEKDFVPYTEIFQMFSNNIRVNILYRFGNLYDELFDFFENIPKNEKEEAINTLFHLLANIDLYAGITKKEISMLLIYDEIVNGYYGVDCQLFQQLNFLHQYLILSYMYLRKQEQNRHCIFFDCLAELFDISLYYSDFENTYIVQIWENENRQFGKQRKYTASQLYEIVKEFLCDFWLKFEVYWEIPIGIVGEEMITDFVQLI